MGTPSNERRAQEVVGNMMKEVQAETWIHDLGLDELSVFSSCTSSKEAAREALRRSQGAGSTSTNGLKRKAEDLDASQRSLRYQVQGSHPNDAIQGILHLHGTKQDRPVAEASSRFCPHSPEAQDQKQMVHEEPGSFHEYGAIVSPQHESRPSPGPRRDKGLRSFSLKVCQKVEERELTTYNEVADELVKEFKMDTTMVFDEKNIRRRIYDALNVLMAMDVITRDRKNIRWKGFPVTNEETRETVLSRIDVLEKSIRKKSREIEKKAFHFLGLKNIVKRNTEQGIGETLETDKCKLQIPFVLAQTKDIHDVELEIHSDRKRASLYFSNKFELHDDKSVLDLMEMHKVEDEESLKQAFPNCPEISSLLLKKRPDIVRKPPSSS